MSDEPDERLADRARRGSRDAFAALVSRFARRVFSLCLRMTAHREDAEDLTQDVFLRAYEALGKFDSRRRFAPWLMAIAANACRNHLRDRSWPRAFEVPLDEEMDDIGGEPAADLPLMALEDAEAVRKAMAMLPPLDRLALLLRFGDGLTVEETAQALEMPAARASVRIFRAKAKLRAQVARRTQHEGGTVR